MFQPNPGQTKCLSCPSGSIATELDSKDYTSCKGTNEILFVVTQMFLDNSYIIYIVVNLTVLVKCKVFEGF